MHGVEDRRSASQHCRQPSGALIEPNGPRRNQAVVRARSGQVRKGVVKNIADFGAFVDLGGIDGLLHITDMSWGRIGHPSEMVAIDQELEVQILHIDREREKIALGLKQKQASPWENVEGKYPVQSRHKGEVVNVMTYGAFVKLEEGIEGLVHISEMSWTKRISHPNELVHTGDEVEVVVLGINKEKQEISLGMKQTQDNPWDKVADRYPPAPRSPVRFATHQLRCVHRDRRGDRRVAARQRHVVDPQDQPSERSARKGSEARVPRVERRPTTSPHRARSQAIERRSLGDGHSESIPAGPIGQRQGHEDHKLRRVRRSRRCLEGLLHISELADHKVENPEDVVKVGDDIEVKVLRVDTDERKIGLSRKRVEWSDEDAAADEAANAKANEAAPQGYTAARKESELKGGVGDGGPLIK